MNIALTFKNFEPSDHLRSYATHRFDKLRRFLPKSENVEMTAFLTVDKFRHKADVQFSGDYISISAQEQSSDMYATVDMVLDKLETQLKRHAERQKAKKRRSGGGGEPDFSFDAVPPAAEEDGSPNMITAVLVEPKPLFLPEAVLQFEQRRDEVVFVFLNAEDSRINILYRRKNGALGLIDPGV
jgi:putative sigma-54 modulation protein